MNDRLEVTPEIAARGPAWRGVAIVTQGPLRRRCSAPFGPV